MLDALDELVGARAVHELPGNPGCYRFAHDLIRAVAYEQLSGIRRARTHLAVGDAIAALDGDVPPDQLAHHYVAAIPAGGGARALDALAHGGRQALAVFAYELAASRFSRALELLGPLDPGDGDESADPRAGSRCELLILLGEAQRSGGDPSYRQTLLDAARLAQRLGDGALLSRAALLNNRGLFSSAGLVDGERVEMLEAALLHEPAGDSPVRAALLASLAVELTFSGDWERRLGLSDDAVAIARRIGAPEGIIRTLTKRFITLWEASTMSHRLDVCLEVLELSRRLDEPSDPTSAFYAVCYGCHAAIEAGDVELAQRLLDIAEGVAKELRQPLVTWYLLVTQAKRSLVGGKLKESEALTYEALAVGQSAGQPDAVAWFGAQLVVLQLHTGLLDNVEAIVEGALQMLPPGSPARWLQGAKALALCELDRQDEARPIYDALIAHDPSSLPKDFSRLGTLSTIAAVCHQLGDERTARALHPHLQPYRDFCVDLGPTWLGATAYYLALLDVTAGRLDAADGCFAEAASSYRRIGCRPWLARTQLDWARMLRLRGDGADLVQSETLLNEALVTAKELGLTVVERRAARLL